MKRTDTELLAAVSGEIRLLEKEMELMTLRMNEESDPVRKEMIRTFGSCLWRHKRALEAARGASGSTQNTDSGDEVTK